MESGATTRRQSKLVIPLFCFLMTSVWPAYSREKSGNEFEVFSLKNLYIPESSFAESSSGSSGKLSVNTLDAGLHVPSLFQAGKTAIVNSLSYQLLEFSRREVVTGGAGPGGLLLNRLDNLTAIEYQLLALHSFSGGRWRCWLTTLHGLYSDMSGGLSAGDYRVQAALAIERSWADGAIFGLGLAYSTTFSFPVLPVLTLHTSPQSAFKLDLVLPFNGSLIYRIGGKAEVGLAGAVEGNRFNVRKAIGLNPPAVADNLRYSVGTIGPRAKLRVAGPCKLSIEAGRTFRRRFEIFKERRKTGEIDLDNNWFVRMAFNVEL
ncbi:MAG: DUF6268 family outer membrane beta-barrel protein [Candidatus Glassbacteria bacterium]